MWVRKRKVSMGVHNVSWKIWEKFFWDQQPKRSEFLKVSIRSSRKPLSRSENILRQPNCSGWLRCLIPVTHPVETFWSFFNVALQHSGRQHFFQEPFDLNMHTHIFLSFSCKLKPIQRVISHNYEEKGNTNRTLKDLKRDCYFFKCHIINAYIEGAVW